MSQLRVSGRAPTPEQISQNYWFSAAKSRDIKFVRKHLEAFQRSVDENGDSALIMAVRNNDLEMVKLLGFRERGICNKSGFSALMVAAARGLADVCRRLASYEQDLTISLDLPDPLDPESDGERVDGLTPLMLAARAGKAEAVKALLQFFSGRQDSRGWTALAHALATDHPECVQVLVADDNEAEHSAEFVKRFSGSPTDFQPAFADEPNSPVGAVKEPDISGSLSSSEVPHLKTAVFTPSPVASHRWASIRGNTVSPNAGPSGPAAVDPARVLLHAVTDSHGPGADLFWANQVAVSPAAVSPATLPPANTEENNLQGRESPADSLPTLSRFDSAPVVELERPTPSRLPASTLNDGYTYLVPTVSTADNNPTPCTDEAEQLRAQLAAAQELLAQKDHEILALKGTVSKLEGELQTARQALLRRFASQEQEDKKFVEMEDIDTIIQRKEQEEDSGPLQAEETSDSNGVDGVDGTKVATFDDPSEHDKHTSKAIFGPMGEPTAWVPEGEVTESEPERFDQVEPSDHSEYADYLEAMHLTNIAAGMARPQAGVEMEDKAPVSQPDGTNITQDHASVIDAPSRAPESSAEPMGSGEPGETEEPEEPEFKLQPRPPHFRESDPETIMAIDYTTLQSENDSLRSQLVMLTSEASRSAEEARLANQRVAELTAELESLRQEIGAIRATTGRQDDRTAATTPVVEPLNIDAFPAQMTTSGALLLSTHFSGTSSQAAQLPTEPQGDHQGQDSLIGDLVQSHAREMELWGQRWREAESRRVEADERAEKAEKLVSTLRDENAELQKTAARLESSCITTADRLAETEMQYAEAVRERDALMRKVLKESRESRELGEPGEPGESGA